MLGCAQILAGILQASLESSLCIVPLSGLAVSFPGAVFQRLCSLLHAGLQGNPVLTLPSTLLHVLYLKSLWLKVPSGAVATLCHCCSACLLPQRWIPAKNICAFSCTSLPCCHGFGGVLLTGAATFQPCQSQYRLKTGTASTLTAVSGAIRCYRSRRVSILRDWVVLGPVLKVGLQEGLSVVTSHPRRPVSFAASRAWAIQEHPQYTDLRPRTPKGLWPLLSTASASNIGKLEPMSQRSDDPSP